MKPTLGNSYPPEWAGYPLQLSDNDLALWIRFRELYATDFLHFYFDVKVGEATMFIEGLEEDMLRVVDQVSRRRIDVVGEKDNEYWIMELRENAGPGAIGSVLTYLTLWNDDPPDNKLATPVIITNYTDKNLVHVCSKLNIIILVI